jgi:hypothetical protein
MSSQVSSRSELFLRGAERYVDALVAINAFEGEVQHICAEIYERHAAELAEQMGLDAAESEPYRANDLEERWAAVGVKRPAQKSCTFWLYLWWDEAEAGKARIRATIYMELYHKALREKTYEQFRAKNPRCRVQKAETYCLMLTTPIKPDALASVGEILDDLVLEWLAYCKSVGGLGLMKKKTA